MFSPRPPSGWPRAPVCGSVHTSESPVRAAEARTPPPLTVFAPTPVAPHQGSYPATVVPMVKAGRQAWSPAHMLQGAENLRIHQPNPRLPRLPTATHSHSHTYMNTQSHTQPYMYACTPCINMCAYNHIHAHIHTHMHAHASCIRTHTYKHTATHTCTQNHTRSHTCTHTIIGTYTGTTHTHTSHTYIRHAQPQTCTHTHTPHVLGLGDLGLPSL